MTISVDPLEMVKKMSQAKSLQISQLESQVESKEGELCVSGVSCEFDLTNDSQESFLT